VLSYVHLRDARHTRTGKRKHMRMRCVIPYGLRNAPAHSP
jgi:hypothetical protein